MGKLLYPPNIQWEVTSECNHNCIHCYNYWRKCSEIAEAISKKLTEKEYLKLANKIIKQKPVSVVVTGGEPLLVFDKVKSSISLLKENGINVSINTNATLLNDEIMKYLVENNIGLFVSFPCSDESVCDFITDTKQSLKRIIAKLDKASREHVGFTLNIVVSTANIDYVESTVDFLVKRYHIKSIYITRVGKPVNSSASFDKFMLNKENLIRLQELSVALAKKHNIEVSTSCPYTACSLYSQETFEFFAYKKICTAGKTTYAIDIDGNVKACPRDSNMYGNILQENFSDIWDRMNAWYDNLYIPDECKTCKEFSRCLGGCRVDSYPFTKKMNSLDRISDIKNIPIKYVVAPKKENIYKPDTKVCLNIGITYLKEENFYRMSRKSKYYFITNSFYEFLKGKTIFCVSDIDDTIQNASKVVDILVSAGFATIL